VHDHDEAVVTLGDENQEFKNEQDRSHANEQAESPAERARRLLAELEQEGAALEGKNFTPLLFFSSAASLTFKNFIKISLYD